MIGMPDVLPVVTPADGVPGPPQGQWTYDDYAALNDDNRYEIVKGVLYYMCPSPLESHQDANILFLYYLCLHIRFAGLGRVYGPPFDVELAPGDVVQPDVIVVLTAHRDRITLKRIVGAPDLVVEIASPGTAGFDRRNKQDAYARAGVPEYWIADPATQTIEVLLLEQSGQYRSQGVFSGQALLPSQVVPGLPVRVEQFFT